jgi:phosphate transport system substrate-binding protein
MARLYSEVCGITIEEAEGKIIASGGTGTVWNSILKDTADLLLVYEAPDSLHSAIIGKELEIAPIGRDGLVFLVNKKNLVNNLTTGQLVDIYTGKKTNWKQVGGLSGPIAAFQRNEYSGSQTLFLKLLMKDIAPMEPLSGFVPGDMFDLVEGVATFDGAGAAIGYSVFYYASLMYANPDIKILSVDGVEPSNESIQNGSYPLTNDFYVVIRADEPNDSPARLLRDWLLTDEGSRLLTESGYVSVKY